MLALFLWVVGVFVPACWYPSVSFDDPGYVFRNPHVASGLSIENVKWAFTTLHGGTSYWHPITWVSHMIDVELFGMDARFHHAVSILIHALNAVLLFLLFMRFTNRPYVAMGAALLFACHPLRVESVVWISERKDVLSLLFTILTFHAYIWYTRRPNGFKYCVVLLGFLTALMSKPTMLMIPALMLLIDCWPLKRFLRSSPRCRTNRNVLFEKVPLIIATGVVAVITLKAQQEVGALQSDVAFPLRLANAMDSYLWYLLKFFWPSGLACFYPLPTYFSQVKAFVLIVILTLIFAVAWNIRKTSPAVLVGLLWYVIAALPTVGLIQSGGQAHADRYSYLPLIGLLFPLIWIVNRIAGKRWWRAIPVVFLLLLSVLSFRQVSFWRDSFTLFERAVSVTPDNLVANNNFGEQLRKRGAYPEAIHHFRLALYSGFHQEFPLIGLGQTFLGSGSTKKARIYFLEATHYDDGPESYRQSGRACVAMGRVDEAKEYFRLALLRNPNAFRVYEDLANLYSEPKWFVDYDLDKALHFANLAVKVSENEDAHCLVTLANVLEKLGERESAIVSARMALALTQSRNDKNGEEACSRLLLRLTGGVPN